MEFIVAGKDCMEIQALSKSAKIDMDLSYEADNREGINDCRIDVSDDSIDYGYYIFCPETEYGGRVLDLKRTTSDNIKTWYLDTWRRMLGQSIIEPPEGEAYLQVSGDANDVLRELLSGRFGGFFRVPDRTYGVEVSGQFGRYVTFLDGITKLFKEYGIKLKISAIQGEPCGIFYVQVEAVPIRDYSEEIEYSQDSRIKITLRDNRRGINHLICLGSGELAERMVRHLYVQEDGTIGASQYYFGIDERVATFDYPNAEDETELLKSGKEKLESLMNHKKFEVSVDDLDVDIGDMIAARDRECEIYIAKPIINKVIKINNGRETIEYKVKGDD